MDSAASAPLSPRLRGVAANDDRLVSWLLAKGAHSLAMFAFGFAREEVPQEFLRAWDAAQPICEAAAIVRSRKLQLVEARQRTPIPL